MDKPQLWLLVGGNGAGKSTFYEQFLKARGLPFVNADLIAREYFPDDPEGRSLEASALAEKLRYRLVDERRSFCFETVFSHPSKIDFLGVAKAAGYEIIMVFIHLGNADLNKARISQRVASGGHNVPDARVAPRIDRLLKNVKTVVQLGLADEVHILNNSDSVDPFKRELSVSYGEVELNSDDCPDWVLDLLTANESGSLNNKNE